MSTQADAILTALGEHGGPGAWRLDRSAVVDRLHELVSAPDRLRQGRLNLCGPAAFFAIWFERDPAAAATYAARLFEDGHSAIGALAVAPSPRLRALGHDANGTTPAADWMMMAALRDSANRTVRYARHGGVGEAAAGITMPGAVARWLRATALFREVRDETRLVWGPGVAHAQRWESAPSLDVVALVAQEMFRAPASPWARARDFVVGLVPNHWIVMRSPVTLTARGQVRFRFWSWGAEHTAVLSASRFRRCYFGSLVAEGWESPLRPGGRLA